MTTTLVDALLAVHQQTRLSGLLTAVAAAGPRLGVPAYIACLLRDPGTDGWYVTAMVDGAGRQALLDRLGIPPGPFPLAPPAQGGPRPLGALMGQAWGADVCARLEGQLNVTGALLAPIPGVHDPRGALLALPTGAGPDPALLDGVLRHGATAAARLLEHESVPFTDGVLDQRTLAELSSKEFARAARYHREMAVALFEAENLAALGQFGPALVRSLRRWDLVGRVNSDRPTLVAVLPETGRGGGRGLIRRLGERLTGIRSGVSTFPEDGGSLNALVDIAQRRMLAAGGFRAPLPPAPSSTWSRQ